MGNINFSVSETPISPYPTVESMDVIANRHETFDPNLLTTDTITSVSIVSQPSTGTVHINDDGTIFYNLVGTDSTASGNDSFTFRAVIGGENNDCTVAVNIVEALQLTPFTQGKFFIFPQDNTTGDFITLKGEGYREWYVSPTGTTKAAISAANGGATVDIDFLIANYPTYGGSSGTAIHSDNLTELLRERNNGNFHRRVYLERGGDYSDHISDEFGVQGISGVYPAIVSAYGTGDRPIITPLRLSAGQGGFAIHEGCFHDGIGATDPKFDLNDPGPCIAFNKSHFRNRQQGSIQDVPKLTIYNSTIRDTTQTAPDTLPEWNTSIKSNKISGMYIAKGLDTLLSQNFLIQNGWGGDGYNEDLLYDADGGDGGPFPIQPPNYFNHNFYCQYSGLGLTVRGNISTRAASQGLQLRAGDFAEYNFHFQNPHSMTMRGAAGTGPDSQSTGNGAPVFCFRNIGTQASNRPRNVTEGESNFGNMDRSLEVNAPQCAVAYNMALHTNDPNDETDTYTGSDYGCIVGSDVNGHTAVWDYNVVYRWNEGNQDYGENPNSADLNTTTLDTATVQLYADSVLSETPGTSTITDLQDHYRTLQDYRGLAKHAYDWFADKVESAGRTGWKRAADRVSADTIKFQPNTGGRADPTRADCVLNWLTTNMDDYAGAVSTLVDSVDTQGHEINFAFEHATEYNNFDLGTGGAAYVHGNVIDITGTLSGTGTIGTSTCGCLYIDGYAGSDLTIAVTGGLVANKGSITGGTDVSIGPELYEIGAADYYNKGYMLLAQGGESCTIGAGKTLEVKGHGIGAFDGTSGTATLTMNAAATLSFTAVDGEFGIIKEFGTGVLADAAAPVVTSVVNLNGCDIDIDATGVAAGDYTVLDVDTLNGSVGTVTGGSIAKVGNTLVITVS